MGMEMGVYMEVSKRQSSERTHQPENAKLTTLDAPFQRFSIANISGVSHFYLEFFLASSCSILNPLNCSWPFLRLIKSARSSQ